MHYVKSFESNLFSMNENFFTNSCIQEASLKKKVRKKLIQKIQNNATSTFNNKIKMNT